eukprot:3384721-Ditylum_brightwellii.AAC.1
MDFVMAYPQADINFDLYMHLPHGVQMSDGSRGTHVLRLLKNLYGQKQAGRTIFLCYIDNGIFASTNQEEIDQVINDLDDKGDIDDYLGMPIEKSSDGRIRITQPQIIQSIIDEVFIPHNLKERGAPASASRLLTREPDAPKFDGRFHY